MKKILIFLLMSQITFGQCPVIECSQSFYITSYEFNPTEANAASGDLCILNLNSGHGVPLWGIEFDNWHNLNFYSTGFGQIYVTEPITIGRGQSLYFTGTNSLQAPSFENGGSLYINNQLNINEIIDIKGENYIYLSDSAYVIVHNPSTHILKVGDVISRSDKDYIRVLQCGTSKTKRIEQSDRIIIFELYPFRCYSRNGEKFMMVN